MITLHKMNSFAAICVIVLISVAKSQPLGDTDGSLSIPGGDKCPSGEFCPDPRPCHAFFTNTRLCIFSEGIGKLMVDKERRKAVKEKGFEALIRTLRYSRCYSNLAQTIIILKYPHHISFTFLIMKGRGLRKPDISYQFHGLIGEQPLKTGSIYTYIHPVIILNFAPRC